MPPQSHTVWWERLDATQRNATQRSADADALAHDYAPRAAAHIDCIENMPAAGATYDEAMFQLLVPIGVSRAYHVLDSCRAIVPR
jgi:hypothetical protein